MLTRTRNRNIARPYTRKSFGNIIYARAYKIKYIIHKSASATIYTYILYQQFSFWETNIYIFISIGLRRDAGSEEKAHRPNAFVWPQGPVNDNKLRTSTATNAPARNKVARGTKSDARALLNKVEWLIVYTKHNNKRKFVFMYNTNKCIHTHLTLDGEFFLQNICMSRRIDAFSEYIYIFHINAQL